MRLFVALDLDDAARALLRSSIEEWKAVAPQIRFVPIASLHITLKFLGDAEMEQCDALLAALAGIAVPGFSFSLKGTGFFPDAIHPKVFWAGVEAPPQLAMLARAIDHACAGTGFPTERRAYTPHLTLARSGSGNPHQKAGRADAPLREIAARLERHPLRAFGKMDATAFHLYESQLHPGGSIYRKIASFPLTAS